MQLSCIGSRRNRRLRACLLSPDTEIGQNTRAEDVREGNVRSIATESNQDATGQPLVVSWVEDMPATTEEDLDPCSKVIPLEGPD